MTTLHLITMSQYVDTTSQRLQTSNTLDNFYAKFVVLEGELSSADMQAAVGNNVGNVHFAFHNFRIFLKISCQQKKCLLNPNDNLL